jgi:glycosyltransferase involved in cell wall biosynthesis
MNPMQPVSVIVPVKNAADTLERCIRALLAQDYCDGFEVIMVDNGSQDGSAEILERWRGDLRLSTATTPGASAARNQGIRIARHPWLAFTDADCLPDPGWLSALMRFVANNTPADFMAGRIKAHRPSTDIELFIDRLYDQKAAIESYRHPYAISANLLVRRSLFATLGLFDEACLRGQDVELSYRGYFRQQATFAYVHNATVEHVHPRTVRALWRKAIQHGEAAAWVLDRYAIELGENPAQRCLDWRRYGTIVNLADRALRERLTRRLDGEPRRRRDGYFDLLVALGKQIGLLRRTCLIALGQSKATRRAEHGHGPSGVGAD